MALYPNAAGAGGKFAHILFRRNLLQKIQNLLTFSVLLRKFRAKVHNFGQQSAENLCAVLPLFGKLLFKVLNLIFNLLLFRLDSEKFL